MSGRNRERERGQEPMPFIATEQAGDELASRAQAFLPDGHRDYLQCPYQFFAHTNAASDGSPGGAMGTTERTGAGQVSCIVCSSGRIVSGKRIADVFDEVFDELLREA